MIHSIGDSIWFTSDSHLGHSNIINYTDRPFANVDEMDTAIINRWNDSVGPDEIVYHLGDFCLGNYTQFCEYIEQLNGRIHILSYPWHHDSRWISTAMSRVDALCKSKSGHRIRLLPPMEVIEIDRHDGERYNQKITLCHYPMESWESSHHGALHLHGHVHTLGNLIGSGLKLDIGVDNTSFRPVSLLAVLHHFGEQQNG